MNGDPVLRRDTDDGVTTLVLNRPEKRNALAATMVEELLRLLAETGADPGVRVIALRGSGRDFCAGADLGEIAASQSKGPEAGLADAGKRWKGHRIFAVDGTKINLPRPLIEEGYRTPSRLVHYPQGLVSCLYQLRSKIPVDFDLHAHENEREAALAHLKALSENDVVVYDRGYYSWEMLHAHAVRGLHPVFRIKRSSAFDAFIAGRETEAIINVAPGKKVLRRLRLKHGCDAAAPCRLRLVKYTAGETVFVLGTTLLDRKTYPAQDLRDLYLGRWGIEELYKISKQLMTVQDFHGQSGRGVKQELYAHFILITLTRLFSNRGEDRIKAGRICTSTFRQPFQGVA